jgi:hypothetical protein
MTIFVFETDAEARAFCLEICEVMVKLFGISRDEAVGRMNEFWGHRDAIVGQDNQLYREMPMTYAHLIYYTNWHRWGENILPVVRPYPVGA